MASIIKRTNKKSGITYAYSNESYWVPELKQSRSRRRLIGKVDPATGAIVPTGRSGPKRKNPPPTQLEDQLEDQLADNSELKTDLIDANKTIRSLQQQLDKAVAANSRLTASMKRMKKNLKGMQTAMNQYIDRCMEDSPDGTE